VAAAAGVGKVESLIRNSRKRVAAAGWRCRGHA